MKRLSLFATTALSVVLLSACGNDPDPAQYGPVPALPDVQSGLLPAMTIANPRGVLIVADDFEHHLARDSRQVADSHSRSGGRGVRRGDAQRALDGRRHRIGLRHRVAVAAEAACDCRVVATFQAGR